MKFISHCDDGTPCKQNTTGCWNYCILKARETDGLMVSLVAMSGNGNPRDDRIREAMRQLTATLHEQLLNTGLVTVGQWNSEIAPKLCEVGKALDGVTVTARTYRVHEESEE